MNSRHPADDPNRIPGREKEGTDEPLPHREEEPRQAPGPEHSPGPHPPADPGEGPQPGRGPEPLELPEPDEPLAEVRERQENQLDEAMADSFPASDPPAFVGSGGTDRPAFPDPSLVPIPREEMEADFPADVDLDALDGLDDFHDLDDLDDDGLDADDDLDEEEEDMDDQDDEEWELDEDDLEPGSGEDRFRLAAGLADDRAPPKPSTDDPALYDDDARRGPYRPGNPSAAVQEGFAENPDGEALDPVFREANPEVDVYSDLPSRRARVGPEDEADDEDHGG